MRKPRAKATTTPNSTKTRKSDTERRPNATTSTRKPSTASKRQLPKSAAPRKAPAKTAKRHAPSSPTPEPTGGASATRRRATKAACAARSTPHRVKTRRSACCAKPKAKAAAKALPAKRRAVRPVVPTHSIPACDSAERDLLANIDAIVDVINVWFVGLPKHALALEGALDAVRYCAEMDADVTVHYLDHETADQSDVVRTICRKRKIRFTSLPLLVFPNALGRGEAEVSLCGLNPNRVQRVLVAVLERIDGEPTAEGVWRACNLARRKIRWLNGERFARRHGLTAAVATTAVTIGMASCDKADAPKVVNQRSCVPVTQVVGGAEHVAAKLKRP